MIMLNLFTGVIINSMQEAQSQRDEETVAEAAAADNLAEPRLAPANVSDIDEKLRAIAHQLHDLSQDVAMIKEQTT
jgi:cob(I)alamin adenosyltransferase